MMEKLAQSFVEHEHHVGNLNYTECITSRFARLLNGIILMSHCYLFSIMRCNIEKNNHMEINFSKT